MGETFVKNVKATEEPVTIYKRIYEGDAIIKDKNGERTEHVRFETLGSTFGYTTSGDIPGFLSGDIIDTNYPEIDADDLGINMMDDAENVADGEAIAFECRWYDVDAHALGDMLVTYSPLYKMLVVRDI